MVIKSVLNNQEIDWDTLQRRFPSVAFALAYSEYETVSCFFDPKGFLNAKTSRGFLYTDSIEKEMDLWRLSLSLEGIEILYVYGVGLGHCYLHLKQWLHSSRERKIIYFEDDLGVLDTLFRNEIGSLMLKDSQVHFYYVPDESAWPSLFEECVQRWMTDRIEWTVLPSYCIGREKKVRSMRLSLLRRSACVHAKVAENLHYPRLIENILSNLFHIPSAFHANALKGKFKNIPAIICGAGYSLASAKDVLKNMEHNALIFAGGSAITALGNYGIRPHFSMAVDPNEEEYERLRVSSCFETSFLFSSRLRKEVLSSLNMNLGYMCSNTGGLFEAWFHQKLGIHERSFALKLTEEALSVTTLATAFAYELGCNPIIFCGVDLAYSNQQRYCPGVLPSSSSVKVQDLEQVKRSRDRLIRRKNVEGKFVHTLVKWVMESACLGSFAKEHKNTEFLNFSSKGLPISHTRNISEQELLSYCSKSYDLRGKIHGEIQGVRFSKESEGSLTNSFIELKLSLENSISLMSQMIEEIKQRKELMFDSSLCLESGKMSIIEMDLIEEPAFHACLHSIFSVYQGLLEHYHPSKIFLDQREENLFLLDQKETLWNQVLQAAEECLGFFKRA